MKTGQRGTGFFQTGGCRLLVEIGLARHPGRQIPESPRQLDVGGVNEGAENSRHKGELSSPGEVHELMNFREPFGGNGFGGPGAEAEGAAWTLNLPQTGAAEAAMATQADQDHF
jgi:hypothetical protein